eukprot:3187137-Pleurochrysis_carterae.AAC.2
MAVIFPGRNSFHCSQTSAAGELQPVVTRVGDKGTVSRYVGAKRRDAAARCVLRCLVSHSERVSKTGKQTDSESLKAQSVLSKFKKLSKNLNNFQTPLFDSQTLSEYKLSARFCLNERSKAVEHNWIASRMYGPAFSESKADAA